MKLKKITTAVGALRNVRINLVTLAVRVRHLSSFRIKLQLLHFQSTARSAKKSNDFFGFIAISKRICISFFLSLIAVTSTWAQRDEQLWLEYQLSYPFGGRYLLENTTSYSTLLNPENKWRSLSVSPTFEMSLIRWLDLVSELGFAYTTQKENANTIEIAPMVGGRFFITQGKKLDTRIVLRYQPRSFKNLETGDWTYSNRSRFRVEMFYSINGPNLFSDKLWYLFADYEEFVVIDQQLEERFANRRRARIGVGYRLSYKHRFDLGYTRQISRNEIDDSFTGADNVIQFKYKMFLNPAKPVQSTP